MNNQKSPMFIYTHGLNQIDKDEQHPKSRVKNKINIQKQIQHFQNLSLCALLSSDIFVDKTVLTGEVF